METAAIGRAVEPRQTGRSLTRWASFPALSPDRPWPGGATLA